MGLNCKQQYLTEIELIVKVVGKSSQI